MLKRSSVMNEIRAKKRESENRDAAHTGSVGVFGPGQRLMGMEIGSLDHRIFDILFQTNHHSQTSRERGSVSLVMSHPSRTIVNRL